MAQGLLFRKDMPPAGVFLLMLAGWVEELGRRTQRRPRKTIILVVMQEIGTVTAPNIIRAKQDTQKELCAASIMSIIAARPGPGGQHHEHHWRLVSPFRGKPKHSPAQSGKCGSTVFREHPRCRAASVSEDSDLKSPTHHPTPEARQQHRRLCRGGFQVAARLLHRQPHNN